jgi:ABC-2 type transport system ATP-binding protein
VQFSDLAEFIDTPVKFYSSGMFMRLGFAVSVLADPDVLLIDEVLAVGDIAFQLKCLDRMEEIKQAGATVVLVSHNLAAIQRMCDRTLVLHHGRLLHDGDTTDAIAVLHDRLGEPRDPELVASTGSEGTPDGPTTIESFDLLVDGRPALNVETGARATFRMRVHFREPVSGALLGVIVGDERGTQVYAESTPFDAPMAFEAGQTATLEATFDAHLATGTYVAYLGVTTTGGREVVRARKPLVFFVRGRDFVTGSTDLRASLVAGVDGGDGASGAG